MLREKNFDVYDFKNPKPGEKGFSWDEIDPNWKLWTQGEYKQALSHPLAEKGRNQDYKAMLAADVIVMLQPCGRSAAFELGWGRGAGAYTAVLMYDTQEPELMFGLVDALCTTFDQLVDWLKVISEEPA